MSGMSPRGRGSAPARAVRHDVAQPAGLSTEVDKLRGIIERMLASGGEVDGWCFYCDADLAAGAPHALHCDYLAAIAALAAFPRQR